MELVKVKHKIGEFVKSTKAIAFAGITLTASLAGATAFSDFDDTQNSATMPSSSDEQQTYNQINAELDQTEEKLKQLDQTSEDSKDTDYALMGC